MRDEHLSSELPSPKVMRNGSLARSTAGSPNMLPTGSVSKYKKLPRHAQRSMLSDVKKIAKNLETHLDSGSVRQCWAMGVAAAADGGGGISSQHAAVETPPQTAAHVHGRHKLSPWVVSFRFAIIRVTIISFRFVSLFSVSL